MNGGVASFGCTTFGSMHWHGWGQAEAALGGSTGHNAETDLPSFKY